MNKLYHTRAVNYVDAETLKTKRNKCLRLYHFYFETFVEAFKVKKTHLNKTK